MQDFNFKCFHNLTPYNGSRKKNNKKVSGVLGICIYYLHINSSCIRRGSLSSEMTSPFETSTDQRSRDASAKSPRTFSKSRVCFSSGCFARSKGHEQWTIHVRPRKLTFGTPKMEVWKMWVMFKFHVNFQGCMGRIYPPCTMKTSTKYT